MLSQKSLPVTRLASNMMTVPKLSSGKKASAALIPKTDARPITAAVVASKMLTPIFSRIERT